MKKLILGVFMGFVALVAVVAPAWAKVEQEQGPWELTAPNAIVFGCGGSTYNHTLNNVANDPSDGSFEGNGTYDPNNSYTWDITGDVSENRVDFTLVYTGTNAGYTLHGVGTISPDGSISGTTDGNCRTFTMGPGSAIYFEGNHGQYVRSQGDKRKAAQSRVGMPVQSKGHTR